MIGLECEELLLGTFFTLHNKPTYKSKRIDIDSSGRLSYRYHHKRSVVWSIPEREDKRYREGETVLIFQEVKNRIQNKGSEKVVFNKVCTIRCFREDEIARIKDHFKRT